MPRVVVAGVRQHFPGPGGGVTALDGVDLQIPSGQLFGLIGHNGAGKSTLFKILLGLIRPTAGQLSIGGADVHGPGFRAVRARLGYLPENLVLYDNLTGTETLRFFARLKGADPSQCAPLLERVGLAQAADRAVRGYSKGMRQRLGFAQALLGEPQVLILDEPTTGLDPQALRDFYAQLDALRAQGVTVLISSHILAELQERVDALAILARGKVLAQGSVAELRARSGRPLTVWLEAESGTLDVLVATLGGLGRAQGLDLELTRSGPERLRVRCPLGAKLRVLQAAVQVPLRDVQVVEATLEDVYFGLREAA